MNILDIRNHSFHFSSVKKHIELKAEKVKHRIRLSIGNRVRMQKKKTKPEREN